MTMADGFVHTVHRDGSWVNEIEGDEGALLASHATKHVAVAAGRDEAIRRKTEHVIHNEDGSIDERNSYGGDPAYRPG
jgi:Uncharacterized protein conserved in bacteria (DUF2188)